MRTIISISLFILMNSFSVYSQIPADTVFFDFHEKMFFVESEKYYVNESDSYLFKDSILISTETGSFRIKSFYYDKTQDKLTIITQAPNARIISLYMGNDSINIRKLGGKQISFIYKNIAYFSQLYERNEIFVYNLEANTIDSISIPIVFSKTNNYFPLYSCKLNNDSILIATGYIESGIAENIEYHLLDEKTNGFRTISPSEPIRKIMNTEQIPTLLYYDLNQNFAFNIEGILNSDYNSFSGFLNKSFEINGLEIINRSVVQLFIVSSLDEFIRPLSNQPKMVVIPYSPCAYREKAMYIIYNNKLLSMSDFTLLSELDIKLLRNMVYAKHNYTFDDKFLTAFFNMYQFYKFNRHRTRLSDVSHLLTEADKTNLELIRAAEEKLKN